MINKIILLITLLAYSFIVSQSFMYILALKNVQLNLAANPYIELRKLIDSAMRSNFKYVIYAALLANLLLVIVNIKNPGSVVFITAAIAFIALVADILLTVKGNLPVNDIINTWSADNYPTNWAEYRTKWFTVFQYRQIASITGFVSLLIGVVFRAK
ncbi:hypothetical protein [Ferruginibacter sp.]|nr:hypothetical protein [Ferruginibacter sp.]